MLIKKVFFDMDGVLADFNRGVTELADSPPVTQETSTKEKDDAMWKKISKVDHFYDKLELMPGAKEMFDQVYSKYNDRCEILSAIPKPHRGVVHARDDKVRWAKRILSPDVKTNIVFRADKISFCGGKEYVLIDDYQKNIDEWEEHGGTGILYKDAEQTLKRLEELEKEPAVPNQWGQIIHIDKPSAVISLADNYEICYVSLLTYLLNIGFDIQMLKKTSRGDSHDASWRSWYTIVNGAPDYQKEVEQIHSDKGDLYVNEPIIENIETIDESFLRKWAEYFAEYVYEEVERYIFGINSRGKKTLYLLKKQWVVSAAPDYKKYDVPFYHRQGGITSRDICCVVATKIDLEERLKKSYHTLHGFV